MEYIEKKVKGMEKERMAEVLNKEYESIKGKEEIVDLAYLTLIANCLYECESIPDAVSYLEMAIHKSQYLGHKMNEFNLLSKLADVLFFFKRYDEVVDIHFSYLRIGAETTQLTKELEETALANIGFAYGYKGEPRKALGFFRQCELRYADGKP
jgi:tetratricopeptide (TPR) repeat protein